MSKPTVLVQLDSDSAPSVFDSVVAVDSGVDHLFRHHGVTTENVRPLVHGAMFTRGGDDLRRTAIFVGGSDVAAGEAILRSVTDTFFGPVRVSVMLDSNGANTTAAAAVLAAARHVRLAGVRATVLAATGPVGRRVVQLLAGEGAVVRVASRSSDRAAEVCRIVEAVHSNAQLEPCATSTPGELAEATTDAQVIIAAGAAGVELLPAAARWAIDGLQVAIDLSAVPPAGIAGIEVTDKAAERDGALVYGAIGVGGTKMKIHKEAVRRLFQRNDQVLDAAEIYEIGKKLEK
jgi:hypothetical protein